MTENMFSEEEEELFGEYFREFLALRHPNPERIGCPAQQILRDLAFRKVNSELTEELTAHMLKCSECVRDVLDYVEEYKANAGK